MSPNEMKAFGWYLRADAAGGFTIGRHGQQVPYQCSAWYHSRRQAWDAVRRYSAGPRYSGSLAAVYGFPKPEPHIEHHEDGGEEVSS